MRVGGRHHERKGALEYDDEQDLPDERETSGQLVRRKGSHRWTTHLVRVNESDYSGLSNDLNY